MPEPAIEPAPDDFGKKLLDWARENGVCLAVIAADERGASRWTGSPVVRLRSPNARELTARELRASGARELRTASTSKASNGQLPRQPCREVEVADQRMAMTVSFPWAC